MASAHSLITESKILYSKESNVYSSTGIAITPYTLSSIQMARYRHCASLKRSVVAPARCLFLYTHFAISCSLLVNKSSVCSFFLFENICGADNSSPSTTYATILRSNNLISCVHVILKISVSFFLFEVVFNQIVNVVGRTAAVAAVQRIFFFVKLCERSFDKRGRRADDSRHPHPEHSTCASGGDCSDNATRFPIPTRVAVETISV